MTQNERLDFLIDALSKEQGSDTFSKRPKAPEQKRRLLRSLMNMRPPMSAGKDFLKVQDDYLQEVSRQKGITKISDLSPIRPGQYLWQGDITTLAADAIVNAANRQLLGCFLPCHGCIDNAIHTYAGIQLRLECARIMAAQPGEEPAGQAKITKAYNLPCRYVLHTVGPVIYGSVTSREQRLLEDCYRSCLDLASAYGLKSVAFCCISTGEFHFPNILAAQIAVKTVRAWQNGHPGKIEVIFNVFKDKDYDIYRRLL
ncbi:MAG: protein-ADP-ribose hydrolase [Clostridiales bacterium]|nr:protein-ADP-ribose hydrolase [Clostridiales bacterium]